MINKSIFLIMFLLFIGFVSFGGSMPHDQSTYENLSRYDIYDDNNISKMYDIGNDVNETVIVRLIAKYSDFLIYLFCVVAKEGIVFGYNHPSLNFKLLYYLVIVALSFTIIFPFRKYIGRILCRMMLIILNIFKNKVV